MAQTTMQQQRRYSFQNLASVIFIPILLHTLSFEPSKLTLTFAFAFSSNDVALGVKNPVSPKNRYSHPNLGPSISPYLKKSKVILAQTARNDDNISNNKDKRDDTVDRLSFLGASVSPIGFVALLSTSSKNGESKVLPVPISSTSDDEFSACSVESLTFLQLLAGVDMASEGILPVQILQRIVALHCSLYNEERENDELVSEASGNIGNRDALDVMQKALDGLNYASATPWQRVRVKLPKVGLNEVRIIPYQQTNHDSETKPNEKTSESNSSANVAFILECTVEGKPLSIQLSLPLVQDLFSSASLSCTEMTDSVVNFYSLSLAARYKVPINISSSSLTSLSSYILYHVDGNNMDNKFSKEASNDKMFLQETYPKWKSATSLQFQSSQVVKTIERGFEANRLDGALRIAIEKGDKNAEEKIREKMKEFESLDDLPVTDTAIGDENILEGDDGGDHWA